MSEFDENTSDEIDSVLSFVGSYKSHEDIFITSMRIKNVTEWLAQNTKFIAYTEEESYRDPRRVGGVLQFEGFEFEGAPETVLRELINYLDTEEKTNGIKLALSTSYNKIGYIRSFDELTADHQRITDMFDSDRDILFEEKERNYHLINTIKEYHPNQKNLKIIDYGGNVGLHYASLVEEDLNFSGVDYTVVELDSIVGLCNDYWQSIGDYKIKFINEIPDKTSKLDIFFSRGGLQYADGPKVALDQDTSPVDNPWKNLFKKITLLKPATICIGELYTSKEDASYLTTQRWDISYMTPYVIYNSNELTSFLQKCGYEAVFHIERPSKHAFQVNGTWRESDRYLSDFIFRRIEK
jgi:putative methyltransferase (TIGR04325 family)